MTPIGQSISSGAGQGARKDMLRQVSSRHRNIGYQSYFDLGGDMETDKDAKDAARSDSQLGWLAGSPNNHLNVGRNKDLLVKKALQSTPYSSTSAATSTFDRKERTGGFPVFSTSSFLTTQSFSTQPLSMASLPESHFNKSSSGVTSNNSRNSSSNNINSSIATSLLSHPIISHGGRHTPVPESIISDQDKDWVNKTIQFDPRLNRFHHTCPTATVVQAVEIGVASSSSPLDDYRHQHILEAAHKAHSKHLDQLKEEDYEFMAVVADVTPELVKAFFQNQQPDSRSKSQGKKQDRKQQERQSRKQQEKQLNATGVYDDNDDDYSSGDGRLDSQRSVSTLGKNKGQGSGTGREIDTTAEKLELESLRHIVGFDFFSDPTPDKDLRFDRSGLADTEEDEEEVGEVEGKRNGTVSYILAFVHEEAKQFLQREIEHISRAMTITNKTDGCALESTSLDLSDGLCTQHRIHYRENFVPCGRFHLATLERYLKDLETKVTSSVPEELLQMGWKSRFKRSQVRIREKKEEETVKPRTCVMADAETVALKQFQEAWRQGEVVVLSGLDKRLQMEISSRTSISKASEEHYTDWLDAMPLPDYLRPDGVFNLTRYLPIGYVGVDISPELRSSSSVPLGHRTLHGQGYGNIPLSCEMADKAYICLFSKDPADRCEANEDASAGSPIAPLKYYPSGSSSPSSQTFATITLSSLPSSTAAAEEAVVVWDIYPAEDRHLVEDFLSSSSHHAKHATIALSSGNTALYMSPEQQQLLFQQTGARPYQVFQHVGEAILIPSGSVRQAMFLKMDTTLLGQAFMSPERVSATMAWHMDLRQFALMKTTGPAKTAHKSQWDGLAVTSVLTYSALAML
ncbi:hypothetical protein EDD11_002501 [Mortierella claussenii]|nr:hypothetical protein EDD11_002501 [Mortierella claussenii]